MCQVLFTWFVLYSNQVVQVKKMPLESYVGLDFVVRLRRAKCQCLRRYKKFLILLVNADRISQSSRREGESEYVVTMSAHKYVHFGVECDLNHPYVQNEEDISNILGAS